MAVRVGIIGTGWGVTAQVPAFRRAGLEVRGLCGRSLEKTQSAAKELSIPFFTTNHLELINHPEIDVVSIVTPPHQHAEYAIAALGANKHVICDKPSALNADEAKRMAQAAREHPNQIAWIDHELRFLELFSKARAAVQNAAFGRILYANFNLHSNVTNQPHFYWWWQKEFGGGILGALGSHIIDAVTYLTGLRLVSTSANVHTMIKQRADLEGKLHDVTADDHTTALFRFNDGTPFSLSLCCIYPAAPEKKLTIVGQKQVLTIDLQSMELKVVEGRNEVLTYKEPKPEGDLGKGPEGTWLWMNATFRIGEALRESVVARRNGTRSVHEQTAADFDQGVYVQQVMDAVRKSHDEKKWLDI